MKTMGKWFWTKTDAINATKHTTRSCAYFIGYTLTHRGPVTHICVSKLTIFGSDNGLSPGRSRAIIWTNAGILLIGPLGTNFSEILVGIQTFYLRKMHLKMSSALERLFRLGLNELRKYSLTSRLFGGAWGELPRCISNFFAIYM